MYRLQVHLSGQHLVTWNPQQQPDMQLVVDRAADRDTTLTAYFKANEQFLLARTLLYQDFPSKFVWDQCRHAWKERQREFAIGHMYYTNPNAGDRFYLCLLLTVVKGATSFENLHTVDGIVHATFKQACIACGLLEDDQEWIQCLQEASHMQTGSQLRNLFVTIIKDCSPAQPEACGRGSKSIYVMTCSVPFTAEAFVSPQSTRCLTMVYT